MKANCWVAIVYDWGDEGFTLATTSDRAVLTMVKRTVLVEAQRSLSLSGDVDEVMAVLAQAELHRLERALNLLIPGAVVDGRS